MNEWLGTNDTADFLGVSNRTLYRMINEGKLPAYRIGRVIRLRRKDLESYLEASLIKPGDLDNLVPVQPTTWTAQCEFCDWREQSESRRKAMAAGHAHVQKKHSDDDEWGFRVRGLREPEERSLEDVLSAWEE